MKVQYKEAVKLKGFAYECSLDFLLEARKKLCTIGTASEHWKEKIQNVPYAEALESREVGEGAVGVGHLVRVFAFFNG